MKLSTNITLFNWMTIFASKYNFCDIFTVLSINVQTSLYKTWNLEKGGTLLSVHPPPNQAFRITIEGKEVHTSPYKTGREDGSSNSDNVAKLEGIRKLHHQANYTNSILNTIAEQMNTISTKLTPSPGKPFVGNNSKSTFIDDVSKPFFKTDSIPRKVEENLVTRVWEGKTGLVSKISEQIKALDLSKKKCVDCYDSSSWYESDDETQNEALIALGKSFESEGDVPQINKIQGRP